MSVGWFEGGSGAVVHMGASSPSVSSVSLIDIKTAKASSSIDSSKGNASKLS